jgi:hypothetical protein
MSGAYRGSASVVETMALSRTVNSTFRAPWQMRPVVNIVFPDGEYSVWTGIFDGEGDYEGLTAIAEVAEKDGFTVRGVVIEGEVPPAPESMSTE